MYYSAAACTHSLSGTKVLSSGGSSREKRGRAMLETEGERDERGFTYTNTPPLPVYSRPTPLQTSHFHPPPCCHWCKAVSVTIVVPNRHHERVGVGVHHMGTTLPPLWQVACGLPCKLPSSTPPLLPLVQGRHDKTENSVTIVRNRHHACRGRGSPQGHNTSSTPVDSPANFPPPPPVPAIGARPPR